MAVDTKKEQEREELHRAIWAIADELRGAVDGWDFKNYVLGTMFYRYISEKLADYINKGEEEAGNTGFKFEEMSDSDAEETRKFLENSFKDGEIKTTGTDIEKILPPISRFGGGGARAKKKETVIDKLKEFFEKYFGIGGKVSFVNVEGDEDGKTE